MLQRACRVLIRKAEGTTWSSASTIVQESRVSLPGIFEEAGIALSCRQVNEDLVALPGGRSLEPADLHAALASMLAKNPTAESKWQACVLIVPEIVTVVDDRIPYLSRATLEACQRSGWLRPPGGRTLRGSTSGVVPPGRRTHVRRKPWIE